MSIHLNISIHASFLSVGVCRVGLLHFYHLFRERIVRCLSPTYSGSFFLVTHRDGLQ